MIPLQEALDRLAAHVTACPTEMVAIDDARGRVTRAALQAAVDLPPFRQSAMDGYALRAGDTTGASDASPRRLPLRGVVAARGLDTVPELAPGAAMRILTGGHVPHGADAVVKQEDVRVDGDHLVVPLEVPLGNNIREQGEEVTTGAAVLPAGVRLTAGRIGALSMAGIDRVTVTRRVRVAVLTTGDEVVPPGTPLAPGQVFDANRALLLAALEGDPRLDVRWSHVPDTREATVSALAEARDHADLIITTGGVSVGDLDHVPAASDAIGLTRRFWKVAQKPGKPIFVSSSADTVLIGLPGNPGAVFCQTHLYVAAALDRLSGVAEPAPRWRPGRLDAEVKRTPTRARLVRCVQHIDAEGRVALRPLIGQASHMLGNLADCDALALVEPGPAPAPSGSAVPWIPVR